IQKKSFASVGLLIRIDRLGAISVAHFKEVFEFGQNGCLRCDLPAPALAINAVAKRSKLVFDSSLQSA
ncbi:MAG TPA: hypothetical protein DDZ51_16710, partial [Planctomycetaceae bacterium]|nr:hypothetical protein [Planctomycetaceae bacterium]